MSNIINSFRKIGFFQSFIMSMFFIDPFNKGYLFGYLVLLFFVAQKELLKSLLDQDFVVLFLFSIVYSIFYSLSPIKGTQYILIYLLFPSFFYLFGKYIAKSIVSSEQLFYFILIVGIIFSFIGLISTGYDILSNGFVQTSRDVSKIWGGEKINATGMAAYLFSNMCIPAVLMFGLLNRKWRVQFLLIVVFIVSLFCVLRLGSRTQIGIILVTLIISLVYKMSNLSPVKNIGIIVLLFVGLNIGFGSIVLDKNSDLLASYATRMDNDKYGASTAGGRTERWEKSLINLVDEPLGWSVEDFGFSHNMWLDAARVGSVIAFVLLVLFSTKSMLKVKTLLTKTAVPRALKNLILIMSIAFFLQFFVEPTLDGSFNLFVFFCLFQGIVNMKLIQEKSIRPLTTI